MLKKLTIIVRGENYDFAVNIKNPEIINRYYNKPGEVTNCLRANIAEAIADLCMPEELKEQAGDMNNENARRKIKLLEERSRNYRIKEF